MRRTLTLWTTLTVLAARAALAQGTAGVEFLMLPVGARPAALGAYAAAGGMDALWYNPASLTTVAAPAAEVSQLEAETLYAQTHVAGGLPLRWGHLGLSLLVQRFDAITLRDETGAARGEAAPQNIVAGASFARSISGGLALGLTVKAIRSDLTRGAGAGVPDAAGTAVALDAGVRLDLSGGTLPLVIGAGVSDLGTPLRYGDAEDPLARRLRAGVAFEPLRLLERAAGPIDAVIAADAVLPLTGERRTVGVAYGAELRLAGTVFLRGGVDGSDPAGDAVPLRLGIGAVAGPIRADVSRRMSSHPALGDEWIVSVGYAAAPRR